MGKLKVIKTGPLATIQDFGRYGHRRYGIPQSGAMDKVWMTAANHLVGNPDHYAVIEFALMRMKLEAIEETAVAVVGATINVNGKKVDKKATILYPGDILEISSPDNVYGYVGMSGLINAKEDFGSVSTYLMAGFGGIEGRALKAGDELVSNTATNVLGEVDWQERADEHQTVIRMLQGPEWELLKELPERRQFEIDPSSDRMGIRLIGSSLECDFKEIASSAVIPGTVQLPSNGLPIVLMNDCQTTGGYPRIGKVIDEDLGKLAQMRGGKLVSFKTIS